MAKTCSARTRNTKADSLSSGMDFVLMYRMVNVTLQLKVETHRVNLLDLTMMFPSNVGASRVARLKFTACGSLSEIFQVDKIKLWHNKTPKCPVAQQINKEVHKKPISYSTQQAEVPVTS